MRRRPHWMRDDAGLAAVEAAILVPVFAALIVLAIVQGRSLIAQSALEHAAYDAARTASIARDQGDAAATATAAATASIASQGLACAEVDVAVDTSQFGLPLGTPAAVTATVTCVVSFSDLTAVPGVPLTRTLTATYVSPIDSWRGRT